MLPKGILKNSVNKKPSANSHSDALNRYLNSKNVGFESPIEQAPRMSAIRRTGVYNGQKIKSDNSRENYNNVNDNLDESDEEGSNLDSSECDEGERSKIPSSNPQLKRSDNRTIYDGKIVGKKISKKEVNDVSRKKVDNHRMRALQISEILPTLSNDKKWAFQVHGQVGNDSKSKLTHFKVGRKLDESKIKNKEDLSDASKHAFWQNLFNDAIEQNKTAITNSMRELSSNM